MNKDRVKEEYRQHTILAALDDGKIKGRIWKDKVVMHDIEGSDIPGTIALLKSFIDERLEAEARKAGSTPDEARVLEGFRKILPRLHDGQFAMLKAHYHADNQELNATELANAAGYASHSSANIHYGSIGKYLYEIAPIDLPRYDKDNSPIYTFYLADGPTESDIEENWKWKLRPEVSKAIVALGLDA